MFYFSTIRPLKKDFVHNLKKSGTWKIQLTLAINFISSKDNDEEEYVMLSKNYNKEIMSNEKADKVI